MPAVSGVNAAAFDHDEADRRGMAERYVAGGLSPEEESRFEEHYATCARCLEAVEQSEALRDGLRDLARDEPALREGPAPRAPRTMFPGRLLAAAAALAAVAVPAFLAVRVGQLQRGQRDLQARLGEEQARASRLAAERDRLAGPRSDVRMVFLSAVRGPADERASPVTLAEGGWAVLAFEVPPAVATPYQLTLERDGRDVVWTSADLRADASGLVSVALPSALLPPGRYRVRLESRAGERSSRVGDHRLDVTWSAAAPAR